MEETKPKKKRRVETRGRKKGSFGANGNSFYKDFQRKTQMNRAEVNEDHLLELKDEHGNAITVCAENMTAKAYPEVFRLIADRYASGEPLLDFLGKYPFPLWRTYVRWRMRYPEFKKMMDEAKIERANAYANQLEHVGNVVDAGTAKAGKVRADILKHLAAVHDPETFGHRTKVVGDKNQPIAFTIVTGVPDLENGEDGTVILPASAERVGSQPAPALHGEGSAGGEGERDGGGAIDHDPQRELLVSVDGDRSSDPETPVGGG